MHFLFFLYKRGGIKKKKKKLRGNTEDSLYIKIEIKARMDCTTCFICQC